MKKRKKKKANYYKTDNIHYKKILKMIRKNTNNIVYQIRTKKIQKAIY